jgi:hypothetical protein
MMLIQLETQYAKPKPRSVFYSYSHRDEDLRNELDEHLTLLKREGFVSTWHDRRILPGEEWDHAINENLNTADVVLFLVSQHFLASKYCRDIEVRRAMERSEKREAIVVPIILRPCVWMQESFAKLQALPKNCRPLVEWPDSGFACVAEELRTMMVNLIYPRLPDGKGEGQHGNWIMKLRGRTDIDNQTRAQQVVARLQEFTCDFSIKLLATAATQIADGEKLNLGLMLILAGAPDAFSKISSAKENGVLARTIGEDFLSFYVVYGATVQGSSKMGRSADLAGHEDEAAILRPGRKMASPILKGLTVREGDGDLDFRIHRGDAAFESEDAKRSNYQQLVDYFYTSLAVKDDLQWVNLSAYESDRMLPPELSGTEMGRNLLSEDCTLKQLTASFMHPNSAIGREYWDAVYAEARRLFGTSKLPFSSFQKVTILPVDALIYEPESVESIPEDLRPDVPPGSSFAYVLKNDLGVLCEEDLIAKAHQDGAVPAGVDGDFALEIFRKVVLPKLKEEVNEGEHFAEIRRIYSAMILSAWLKRSAHKVNNERIRKLVDSGNTKEKFKLGSIRPVSKDAAFSEQNGATRGEVGGKKESGTIDHATPYAAAFKVPENVEFYARYVKLFKDGLFRCTRNETGDVPDERVIRVYFSGSIDFRNLSAVVKFVK